MRIFRNKIVKVVSITALSLIMLPVIAYAVLYIFVLPPKKLTPLLVGIVNDNLNAQFECKEIELTFFSTYPNLGIRITDGYLCSSVAKDTIADRYDYKGKDTLLTFRDCKVLFKITDYIRNDKITIKDVKLEKANIYGFINSDGKANWDIIKNDTLYVVDTVSTPLPPINVERLTIHDSHLALYNKASVLYTSISGLSLSLKGKIANNENFVDIEAEWEKFRYYSNDYSLQNTLKLKFNSQLRLSENFSRFTLGNTNLLINNIPFSIEGELFNNRETASLDMDIVYGLNIPDIESLFTFIPAKYIEGYNLKTKGEIALNGTIKGTLGNGNYPVINSVCSIKNASVHSQIIEYGIEDMALNMDLNIDMANNKLSYINLNKAYIKSESFLLDIEAKLTDLLTNPVFDGKIKSDINFTQLSKSIFQKDTINMEGKFFADLKTRFTLNDILTGNYGKIQAAGNINISDFKAVSEPYEFDVTITNAKMTVTSERSEDKIAKNQRLLNAKLYIDSFNVVYAKNINTSFRDFYLSLGTPSIPDTSAVVPIAGRIKFGRLETKLPDSTLLAAFNTEIKGAIMPSPSNKKTTVVTAIIDADSLVYLIPKLKTGAMFAKSSFDVKATPYVRQPRIRNANDSIFRQRDTTLQANLNIQRDSTLILAGTSSELLSKWDVSGKLSFDKMQLWSVYFPIRTEMLGSSLKFTSNEIFLSNAKLTLGKSDFLLNGNITNIRRALLRGGRLYAELETNSKYINCDELMDAISKGIAYGETFTPINSDTGIENISDIQSSINEQAELETSGVFVLPRYLDLLVHTKAKQIDYQHLSLENTDGLLILRDQSAQLTNFHSKSNIGQGNMSLFYSAKNKKEASVGVDIDLKNILVEKFISLMPAIDTLVPMLKSFEGILDCQMVATCLIDSTTSIVLPSLQAACYLQGANMVLLDGETFTEISKKLMFKNKKRNQIDSIAVDLTIKDSYIEVYPFLVELDRYRLAAGGTHNLNMTFNYHLSVLKSPVPFKMGIDITGSLDNFKYKITNCRYKDVYRAAKTGTIDTARLNIKRNIYNSIQERIKSNLINYHPLHSSLLQTEEEELPEKHKKDSLLVQPLAMIKEPDTLDVK